MMRVCISVFFLFVAASAERIDDEVLNANESAEDAGDNDSVAENETETEQPAGRSPYEERMFKRRVAKAHKDLELAAEHVKGAARLSQAAKMKAVKHAAEKDRHLNDLAAEQSEALKGAQEAKDHAIRSSERAEAAELHKNMSDKEYLAACKEAKETAAAEVPAHASAAAATVAEEEIEKEWAENDAEGSQVRTKKELATDKADRHIKAAKEAEDAYQAAVKDAEEKAAKAQEATEDEAAKKEVVEKAAIELREKKAEKRKKRLEEIEAVTLAAKAENEKKLAILAREAAETHLQDANRAAYVAKKHAMKEKASADEAEEFEIAGQQVHDEKKEAAKELTADELEEQVVENAIKHHHHTSEKAMHSATGAIAKQAVSKTMEHVAEEDKAERLAEMIQKAGLYSHMY